MGAQYLTGLADWLRSGGLRVVEIVGWQTRARGSGGYEAGRPWCVLWHHTASNTTPESDLEWIVNGCPDAPVLNLYLDRAGVVYVCAAGATNTNGKGGPFRVSKGVVPVDQMNTYAVSIEAANNGVGQNWPVAQIDAYFTLNNALAAALDLDPADLCTHAVWAPTRKIDPAKAEAVDGDWWPRASNTSGTWVLGDIQDEAAARAGHPPPPDPGGTVDYFTLKDQPATLWASADGLVAVRLESHQLQARGDVPPKPRVMSTADAARYVFVAGLPSLSAQ